MDAGEIFRQGLGSVNRARQSRAPLNRESSHESEGASPKIAHTLAACCRCRQRKTRCDPTLPKCSPCERAGAVCEYFDTTKNKRISRTYVIRLQDRVRALQLELAQYVEEDGNQPDTEDSIRPGGLVRLEGDETPKFLGPSSGIAMTRLVMEEARKYTDTQSIRELVPEISKRRTPAQSPDTGSARKRSYPMVSEFPADRLPSRTVRDKLIQVFNEKAQYLFPTLHEPTLFDQFNDVYNGDEDPYKNFIVRIVLAISMQKLDIQYAGLADSYYIGAMAYVEQVIRPMDLNTLQCLVLIGQYSVLTPTKTPIYYIIGLATRLAQQLGLTEEKTICMGSNDPLELDMRRRLSWVVLSMEFGLAHSLGRPNGWATGFDHVDVDFYATVDDKYITSQGITSTGVSEKKVMSIHFMKMRLLQAEIRRTLYQRKRSKPVNDQDPWFAEMEKKLYDWLDASPLKPAWGKPWFMGKLNTMIVFLFRPSPQIPKPSVRAAHECFKASAFNIKHQHKQMDNPTVDITWIFLQSLFMAVNTMLWSISYVDVRQEHPKEEVEKVLELGIDVMIRCTDRWPGSANASELYQRLWKALLRSYDQPPKMTDSSSSLSANSPASAVDANSPFSDHSGLMAPSMTFSSPQRSQDGSLPPQFNYIFNESPEAMMAEQYVQQSFMPQQPPHPQFRSNSIFAQPATRADRRFSYFPPEFMQQGQPGHPQAFQPQQPQWLQPSSGQQQQQQQQMQQSTSIPIQNTSPPLLNTAPNLMSGGNFSTVDENSYFMQPSYTMGPQTFSQVSFNPSTFAASNMPGSGGGSGRGVSGAFGIRDSWERMGSLSYSQQTELFDALESGGQEGIDAWLGWNMPPPPPQ